MTAELRTDTTQPQLLIEPTRPKAGVRCTFGWERRAYYDRDFGLMVGRLVRRSTDDAAGARLQHAIVRYIVGGETRADLARELAMSETSFQYALRGKTWVPYTRPVLLALKRLGIGAGRGNRSKAHQRLDQIIAAQQSVMEQALATGLTDRVRADMRLFVAARRLDE